MAVVLLIASCDDESDTPGSSSVGFSIRPHNSNNEFYAGLPVWIAGKPVAGPPWTSFMSLEELFVNGSKVAVDRWSYTFTDEGIYQIKARIKMLDRKTYEIDTTLTIVAGPPVIGAAGRGEQVLFSWKAGVNYNVLMKTYHGSSANDYEVLTIDESLVPQGALKTMDFGWYPEFIDYDASASGKLAVIYDDGIEIYSTTLAREHQLSFLHGRGPRRVLMEDNHATVLFDSLSFATLRSIDFNSGAMVKGPTQFVGVDAMTTYRHYFLDDARIATFYASENNDKTLLMGTHIGGKVEFNQYFQPPVFIDEVTPIPSGGYIINTHASDLTMKVMAADASNVVQWTESFTLNHFYQWQPAISVKVSNGFIYAFFDNMRCAKLSMNGQVIWDKYFYPENASFQDVVITPEGDFILFGTCLPPYRDDIQDYSRQTDVVCIKIDDEGMRIGE